MKLWHLAVLPLFLTACAGHAIPPSIHAPSPIFRYINVSPHGQILHTTLGSTFSADSITDRLSDSAFTLKPGTFGGAEQIRIYVRSDRQVYAFEFDYPVGTDFRAEVADYADLGPPSGEGTDATGAHRVFWLDSTTRFEVLEQTRNGGVRVESRLTDLTP